MANQYISAAEFAKKFNFTETWVWRLLREGRIPGAIKVVDRWLIPADAVSPVYKERVRAVVSPAGYETATKTAARWGVSSGLVRKFCNQGRIPGAVCQASRWLIPADAVKPAERERGRRYG